MQCFDLVIIGGGASGLMAAITAREEGVENILVLERENILGGALNEYIHTGFGLSTFKEELAGPEYAQKLIDRVKELSIPFKINTLVIDLTKDKTITYVNSNEGVIEIKARAIILAMGCRERPRGVMNIPKSRCAGIFTAGSAQKFVNMEGYLPGKEVLIMGSGDMGAIISRRLILEGAMVKAVVDHMPYVTACDKNITECFESFNIPLMLSHTVVEIKGTDRVEGVVVVKVDKSKKPIPGTEKLVKCDSLIFSMGLYPENEIAKKANIDISAVTRGPKVDENMHTNIEGVFVCGNALHIHNNVDQVTEECQTAIKTAVKYLDGKAFGEKKIEIVAGEGVKYTVPNYISDENSFENLKVCYKVDDIHKSCKLAVYFDNHKVDEIQKSKLTVGNIETLILKKQYFSDRKRPDKITLRIEQINI